MTSKTPGVPVSPAANFWWATQTGNYPDAYPEGTLWAPLRGRSGQRVDHWETLNGVQPGDIVLHYVAPEIRGISRAATAPTPAVPPLRGYTEPADTDGVLVLTEPLFEVRIPWEVVANTLPPASGPLTVDKDLRRGFFFGVDRDAALRLLEQAGLAIDPDETPTAGRPAVRHLGGPSDRWTMGAVRTEQRYLRNQQLQLRGSSCSICGQSFPEELLVAAHIKPRSACSEEERMDTRNVSMLACLFGCDALFEHGYLTVGDGGIIEAGRPGPGQVGERMEDLLGRKCLAHDERSMTYFAWHRETHHGRLAEA
ncbi:HNH endonuclease signature motif containing protein [Pseudarthrobacter chlorophenolicus]|nr:HNH endonuclease signature motif containing protein [Pseudarthrobacter chlorophenolicus]